MKFALPTFSSFAYTLFALLLLGFSLPMVTPILASDNPDACKSIKPPHLNTVADFMSRGYYQQECEKNSLGAVSSFTQAIRLNPISYESYYARANAYADIGNYKAAVADYTKVIKKDTGRLGLQFPAYWNRARSYEKLGEKQKAISDWTYTINKKGSTGSVEAYIYRGNMYRDVGNKENAINDYKIADKILQQNLNGVFANSGMDSMYEGMLNKVRNELSILGISLPAPQLQTRNILYSIAKIEVERALNLAKFTQNSSVIEQFDGKLQDLYKQLANSQPQPYKNTEKNLISNAAYKKIDALKIERYSLGEWLPPSQLLLKFTSNTPIIMIIDTQINELEALISRNKV
jgi:tetratricopeptide (TPR) repeat protein